MESVISQVRDDNQNVNPYTTLEMLCKKAERVFFTLPAASFVHFTHVMSGSGGVLSSITYSGMMPVGQTSTEIARIIGYSHGVEGASRTNGVSISVADVNAEPV